MSLKVTIFVDMISGMGGTRTFLERLILFHSKQRYSTLLVIPRSNLDESLKKFIYENNTNLLTVSDRSHYFYKSYISLFYDLYVFIKAKRQFRADLSICSVSSPGFLLGGYIFRSPLIYLLHTYPNKPSKNFSMIRQFGFPLDGKKRIVTVSKAAKRAIIDYWNLHPNSISVLYNSVRLPLTNMNKSPQYKNNFILTAGHVISYKNPTVWYSVAKKVLEKFPNCVFVWAGDGLLLDEMRKKAEQDAMSHSIIFRGFCQNMDDLYLHSNIYFHPSRQESHGLAILEAMSYRLPVVSSNAGGIPESVINGKTGFLHDCDDIDGFFNSICLLLSNPEKAKLLGSNGFDNIIKKFSIDSQDKMIRELYESVSNL